MHRDHDIFVRAIKDKRKVKLVFLSDAGGNNAEKLCGPILYSPPAPAGESDWYYLWDFEGSSDKRVLGLPSNKIVSMEPTEETFNSGNFISPEGNLAENKARQYNNGSTMDSEESILMEPMCEKEGDIAELARHLVNKIRETCLSERKETVEEGGNTASQNVDTEQKN